MVLKGNGHVEWTGTEKNTANESEKIKYTAKEKYIKNKIKLLEGGNFSFICFVFDNNCS